MLGLSSRASAAPWQFKWKCPTWQKLNEDEQEQLSADKPPFGTPVAHAAAALLPTELVAISSASLPAVAGAGALTLTVTLLQSSRSTSSTTAAAAASAAKKSYQLADVVVLKVLEQPQPPSSETNCAPRILQSRVLRWPTTDIVGDNDNNEDLTAFAGAPDLHVPSHRGFGGGDAALGCYEPMNNCLQNNPLLALFSILGGGVGGRNKSKAVSSGGASRRRPVPRNGLVAAALVRLPHAPPPSSSSSPAPESLRLNLPPEGELYPNEENEDDDAAVTDLVLACLSSEGKIHFYSPWTLLGTNKKSHSTANDEELEESMASFLFGSSLLTTVQETILPLSQPDRTIRLSLPFLQRNHEQRWTSRNLEDTNNEGGDNDEQQKKKQPLLAFLDASTWDPVLDAATLPFQTVKNVATLCVAALDYLVVAGKGRQRWKTQGGSPDGATETHEESENIEGEATRATTSSSSASKRSHDGGFVTFVSLENYTETRTVFLPFVPSQVSPFVWGSLRFLLVVSRTGRAVAIHMEATQVASVPQGEAPRTMTTAKTTTEDHDIVPDPMAEQATTILIHPFEVLPIGLSGHDDSAAHLLLVGSEISTSPPSIAVLFQDSRSGEVFVVQQLLHAIDLLPQERISGAAATSFQDYGQSYYAATNEVVAVITTVQEARHATRFIAPSEAAVWCQLGQGWCLVGFADKAYFVCFEGSNSESGAFLYELNDEEAHEMSQSIVSSVLPVRPLAAAIPTPTKTSPHHLGLPFTELLTDSRASVDDLPHHRIHSADSGELDDIVVKAMESISHLSYRDSVANQSPSSPSRKAFSFSHREKSRRLLRHCTSWTRLESQTRPRFESQTPVVSVETKSGAHFMLSLRTAAVENGPATPFQVVLGWLAQQEDFFTAASLALDLLRDGESLRHLWRAFDRIDDEDERSKLEGLLDGIVPIYSEESDKSPADTSPLNTTVRQLADMTVGCLTKGGYSMSSTLEQFLVRNSNYDPSRASLMLVAMAANAVSDDPELVASVMGKDYIAGEEHLQCILWPVRCVLKVGVARDHLLTALMLLNTTIPDELRRRNRGGVASNSIPSLEMCKSLVSLIVAASNDATGMLLDLVDEKTRSRFWDSLEHETRLQLSLICISDKLPLLLDPEVRSWGLKRLEKCIEAEKSATSSDVSALLPTQWLCELVFACLRNAGCNIDVLLHPICEKREAKDLSTDDGLSQYGEEVVAVRRALMPAPASGGLDFGLVIPALLVVEHRDTPWHGDSETSTRSVLNAACYLAGRRSVEEPMFALNGSTLMRQCTLVDDVEAGANLIGGQNGLILECCRIMINEMEMDMGQAETYLVYGSLAIEIRRKTNDLESSFTIRDCHRRILWLLEEHVLKVRTYGEFETAQARGKIDPVFAATACLRTWWMITQHRLSEASSWLTMWLRRKLSIFENTTQKSPNRLVCAALVRALLWPDQRDGGMKAILAYKLQLDSSFVVQLSQSCCGLVEALPDYVSEGDWKRASVKETPVKVVTSPQSKAPESHPSGVLDESFVSAASSLGDQSR